MFTMIFISSIAILVGILGSVLIWGLDAVRSDEIERTAPASVPADPALGTATPRAAVLGTEGQA